MSARATPPPIRPVGKLQLPDYQSLTLDNGIPVVALDLGTQDIVKLEIVYRAGRNEEQKRLASRATARLLRDGTTMRTGAEIADQLDFWGASMNAPVSLDFSSFNLYSLKKYADRALPIFSEVMQSPIFPEKELETFVNGSVQELAVELTKPETVAYRLLTELIFGVDHPYGWNSVAATYQGLRRDDLVTFYQDFYTPQNALLVVAGRVDSALISLINKELGQKKVVGKTPKYDWDSSIETPRRVDIELPNTLQSAIKIGRRLFPKNHDDHKGLFVLNTILGGYFGSRLMTNIREKKGYTYNIYSTIDTMLHDGYFYIATEVSADKAEVTIREIFKEMEKLTTKLIPESELEMVRNYLLGIVLTSLDGAMNVSDMIKNILLEGLPMSDFDRLVEVIRTISAHDLRQLARQYFTAESMWTVVVK
jgi:zinc protease